jgi:hypothetical protein
MAFFPGHGRLFYPAAPFYPSVNQKHLLSPFFFDEEEPWPPSPRSR